MTIRDYTVPARFPGMAVDRQQNRGAKSWVKNVNKRRIHCVRTTTSDLSDNRADQSRSGGHRTSFGSQIKG
ncbi:MAG TPA: hypothetical protein VHY35_10930 [Stellaceae bacterium]|nr:hypothetical protein [Stellaceae bacterium]